MHSVDCAALEESIPRVRTLLDPLSTLCNTDRNHVPWQNDTAAMSVLYKADLGL